ncbi:MAG: DUF1080 domain-containing protein [Gemmataceae bacterium]|nr:DUF1080 domain-containing protein [Gemmataceae bacterium]
MFIRSGILLLAGLCVFAQEPVGVELFNGKDLDGWKAEGVVEFPKDGKTAPVWVARDGMISCMVNTRKSFGFLRYEKKEFADFHLALDYRLSVKENPKQSVCNSGLGIRTVVFDPKRSTATRPSYAGYEIQLLDDAGKKPDKHSTGSLYRYVAPLVNPVKPAPDWNHMEITCKGPKITIAINGEKIIDADQSTIPEIATKPLKGYISLQNHGGQADFKNLRVRELK